MKGLIRILCAALLASSTLASSEAWADGKDRGGRPEREWRGGGGGEWRGERRGGGEREWRGERRGGGERDWRDERRGGGEREWRGERRGRDWDDGQPAYGYPGPPAYQRRSPAPGYAPRRGGVVPPQYRGAVVPDYGRHRLRPPPPGFAWVRMGDRYLLVSRSTGQIFDVIGD